MQTGGTNQLTVSGSNRKTGSNHIKITSFFMPGFDQLPTISLSAFFSIHQRLRCVTVHQDLTGQHLHVIFGSNRKESINRFFMNRSISHTGRSAVAKKFIYKETGYPSGIFRISKSLFRGIRIFVQPIEQLFAIHTYHFRLRIMDM